MADIFRVFARGDCEAERGGTWAADQGRRFVEWFVEWEVIPAAYRLLAPDAQPFPSGLSLSGFRDRLMKRLRESEAWTAYLNERAAVSTSVETPEPATTDVGHSAPSTAETKASVRRRVVEPLLKFRGWSSNRWAKEANVDSTVVYDYMNGKGAPRPDTRVALAEAIGLPESEFPA